VVALPHRVLKLRADELGEPSEQLARDLVDTMRSSPACVGLAAPQIGISKRAFVVDVTGHPKTKTCHGLVLLFDPVIVESSGNKVGREGCMSVPHITANVARATELVVAGTSPEGEELVIATDGFEARAVQHELDHLDGMLILDRVNSLSTDVFRRQVYK
jgi:peptide deformylase